MEPLFWRLEKFGKGQTEQVNIVYDLFVEFGLDDYGKIYSTKDTEIGEKEQKERIRIHFQQKAIKERYSNKTIFLAIAQTTYFKKIFEKKILSP